MNRKRLEQKWAEAFDGEKRTPGIEEPVPPEAESYVAGLERLREGARLVRTRAEVADAQFPAFMAGIRERMEARRAPMRGMWALASLTAASVIVALSVFYVITGGGAHDAPTVVEAAGTGIEDARVDVYSSEDGTATVWVRQADRDLQ